MKNSKYKERKTETSIVLYVTLSICHNIHTTICHVIPIYVCTIYVLQHSQYLNLVLFLSVLFRLWTNCPISVSVTCNISDNCVKRHYIKCKNNFSCINIDLYSCGYFIDFLQICTMDIITTSKVSN